MVVKLILKAMSCDWVRPTSTGYDIDRPTNTEEIKLALQGLINQFSSNIKISKSELSAILKALSKEYSNDN